MLTRYGFRELRTAGGTLEAYLVPLPDGGCEWRDISGRLVAIITPDGVHRDISGRQIGYYLDQGGYIEVRDTGGVLVGYIEKSTGDYRDAGGRLIGYFTKGW